MTFADIQHKSIELGNQSPFAFHIISLRIGEASEKLMRSHL